MNFESVGPGGAPLEQSSLANGARSALFPRLSRKIKAEFFSGRV
jgi:hypothetical protein